MTNTEVVLAVGVLILFVANISLFVKFERIESLLELISEALELSHKIMEQHDRNLKRLLKNEKEGKDG